MPKLLRPYCQSKFADKKEISMYIDQIHGGTGLREGDKRQF